MLFLLFSFAFSDLILTSETTKDGEKVRSTTYITKDSFLVETPSKQSGLMYDGKTDQFIIIDHKEKKTTIIYQRDLFTLAKERAKNAPDVKALKKAVPALNNPELESLLDEVLKNSSMSYQNLNIRVQAEKDDRKWGKLATKRFDAVVNGKRTLSLWILPSSLAKLSADEMKSLIMSAKLLRFFVASMGQETASTAESAYLKVLEKEQGILVFSQKYNSDSSIKSTHRVIEFKRVGDLSSKFVSGASYTKSIHRPK